MQTLIAPRRPVAAGNHDTDLLKVVACVCMIIDHVGAAFFSAPLVSEFRVIGRIAFPLYAWCLIIGVERTRSIDRYAARMLLSGLVSQPLYVLALGGKWTELNIFFTLLLGLLGIAGIRINKCGSRWWAPILAVCLATLIEVDYGWKGVLFILLLYGARERGSALAAVMVAFCLYWGGGTFVVKSLFGVPLPQIPYLVNITGALYRVQAFALLALPLMLIPTRIRLRMPQIIYYSVYPAHLLLLWLVKLVVS